MSKRGKIKHEVPAPEDAEAALLLLGFKSKENHLPKTFVRYWKLPWEHPLRPKQITIWVRFWPDGRKRVNYILSANTDKKYYFDQRINTNDGAKCLAILMEIINE